MNNIFDDAKHHIVTNGWRKGSGDTDAVCVVNAVYEVAGSRDEAKWAAETLHFIASRMWPTRVMGQWVGAANFNDHKDTTLNDIFDLLDAAHAHEQERAAIEDLDGVLAFIEDDRSYREMTA